MASIPGSSAIPANSRLAPWRQDSGQAGDGTRTHNNQLGRPSGGDSKDIQNQEDTDPAGLVAPKSVPSEPENAPDSASSDHNRLAVIADLLADLPEAQSREAISQLTPQDHVAVAQLLIARQS